MPPPMPALPWTVTGPSASAPCAIGFTQSDSITVPPVQVFAPWSSRSMRHFSEMPPANVMPPEPVIALVILFARQTP